jgi:hypothetical protein
MEPENVKKPPTPPAGTPSGDTPSTIPFHYIKSVFFRVLHVDGALGGITPRGLLHIAFYNERQAIPQTVFHPISEEGRLGEEISDRRVTKGGIVREVEADVLMDERAAAELYKWLGERLADLKRLKAESEEGT